MMATAVTGRAGWRARDEVALGLLIGVVMPVVAALCYPTYVHYMPYPWLEWTRLAELPFVACELVLIQVALRRGYADRAIWDRLPRDIRWAMGLLLVGLTVSSVFVSKDAPRSIALSLFTLIHLRFAAAMYFLARERPGAEAKPFVLLLGAGLGALAVLIACRFALAPPPSSVPGGRIEWGSAMPGFISVRHLGSWTGAIAAGLMLWLLYGREPRPPAVAWLYLLAATMTCWSGTRAAVLALAVVALIAAVTLRRLPTIRATCLIVGLSVAALVLALLLVPPGEPEFLLYTSSDAQSAGAMTGGRLALWTATWHRWLDAPLFGWGSGSVFWEVYVGWSHTQPHNVVLQFLISWGVVGAAGGLWLLGRAIVAVHRRGLADEELRPLMGVLLSLLFMSLLEGMLFYPRFIMPIMIGFAIVLAKGERCPAIRDDRGVLAA